MANTRMLFIVTCLVTLALIFVSISPPYRFIKLDIIDRANAMCGGPVASIATNGNAYRIICDNGTKFTITN